MNFKDYVKLATVTESRDTTPIAQRFQDEWNLRLTHAAIGLVTEVTELFEALDKDVIDMVNIKEECGDLYWYAAIAADVLALESYTSSDDLFSSDLGDLVCTLAKQTGEFLDFRKKFIYYGKVQTNEFLTAKLVAILQSIDDLVYYAGGEPEQVQEVNIQKLKARYGSKFSEAAAITRNLDAERTILEA